MRNSDITIPTGSSFYRNKLGREYMNSKALCFSFISRMLLLLLLLILLLILQQQQLLLLLPLQQGHGLTPNMDYPVEKLYTLNKSRK